MSTAIGIYHILKKDLERKQKTLRFNQYKLLLSNIGHGGLIAAANFNNCHDQFVTDGGTMTF
jgi:hypothetical protein